jgi:hypothetical protein
VAIIKDLAQPRKTTDNGDFSRISAPLGTRLGRRDAPPSSAVASASETTTQGAGSLLATLPRETQARLHAIGAGHRTEFGTSRRVQSAFDQHIGFLDTLIARGASHAVIAGLLADVGVARADGTALPIGTVSGALSRARERARATGADVSDQPASRPLQVPAGSRKPPQDHAGARRTVKAPTAPASIRPRPTARGVSVHVPHREGSHPAAPDVADILNRLRTRSATGADHE